MNFTLTISGESPAELLNTLTQLGGMTINVNTSPNGGVETRTMTAAAPAEELASPTTAEASGSPSQADTAPATSTSAPAPDPAMLDKIRDLARSLIVAGKRAGVQAAIKATGAASISKLPPDSYTSVLEELLKLEDEVDANASN